MSYQQAYQLQGLPVAHTKSISASNLSENYPPPSYAPNAVDAYGSRIPATRVDRDNQRVTRTPSPTPSEMRELQNIGKKSGLIDWQRIMTKEYLTSKEGIKFVIIAVILLAIVIVFAVLHKKIVIGLTPATNWCKDHTWGWLIPVAILIVLSFPPLAGHELVGMLCGIGWGLGEGFGIMALGTLLGEIANFFVFKFCCTTRARKYEQKKIFYACFARVIRTGGFPVAVAARYSLIPGHLTTTVFASSGMSFLVFLAAAICSLPKQFATVVIGVLLGESVNGTSRKDTIVSILVSVVTFVVTSYALRFLNRKIDEVKPQVIYERRKARQAAELKALYGNSPAAFV